MRKISCIGWKEKRVYNGKRNMPYGIRQPESAAEHLDEILVRISLGSAVAGCRGTLFIDIPID